MRLPPPPPPPAAALLLGLLLLPFQPSRAEGLVLRLEPGYALWQLDAALIQAQTSVPAGEVQALLVDQTQNAPATTLLLGYNLRDHLTLSAGLTATGWDLGSRQRGGAGLAALEAAWHPAALLLPGRVGRERPWDAALFLGAGYGVVGEQRALDGLHLQAGLRGEYFLTPWLSLGGVLRYAHLRFGRYVTDWSAEAAQPLPRTSGGGVLLPALTLSLHAPLGGG